MTRAIKHFIGPGRARGSTPARIASRAALWLLAGSVSATTLLGQCPSNTLTFTDQGVASGTYQAVSSITADAGGGGATTTINSGASVTFQAGTSITLLPNFHAAPGSSFQASVPNTALPAVYPATLSLLGGGGLECATVMAAPGVSWTASTTSSWIALSNNTGTGSGTFTYLVSASGTSIRTGIITVTSSGGSATLTVTEAALASGGPTAELVTPLSNGSLPGQVTQNLSFTFGSPNGPGYLNFVNVSINNLNGGMYACSVDYYPESNILYFFNAGAWSSYTPGEPGQQAIGDHCNLNVAESRAVLNPLSTTASVTLSLALTLQSSAVGAQNVYVFAEDDAGGYNSNSVSGVASWTAFNLVTTDSPTVSMIPPVAGDSGQVLHYQIGDGNGYTYLIAMYTDLSSNSSLTNSPCYFEFQLPDLVYLLQVANGTQTLLGMGYLGGSWTYPANTGGILGGSGGLPGPGTCSINLNQSSVSTGTDGTGTLRNPDTGNPSQQITSLYLDLSTGLDSTAQATLPLNVYLTAYDLTWAANTNSDVGTWSPPGHSTLTVASSHPDPFLDGQASAYTLTVANTGSQATSGTVTLTDTLPSALTLTSMSGSGWSCSGATCTYSNSVAAGASFPAITVAVTPTAAGSWSNQATVSGGGSATAYATDPTDIILPYTFISTFPVGLSVTVDGSSVTCSAYCEYQWTPGSSHTIAASTQAGGTGTQWAWANWSDSGGASHGITAGTSGASYTATFNPQYQFTSSVSPAGAGTVSPGNGWYSPPASFWVTATPATGYQLSSFSPSGYTYSYEVVMNGPVNVTANFGAFSGQAIASNPPGAAMTVDGAACTAPCTFNWTAGTQHTVATTSPQTPSTGTQLSFSSWSDGGAISHTITAAAGVTYTATFTAQYYLTTTASPAAGGSISPASGWYNSGQVVQVSATPERLSFHGLQRRTDGHR